ncbi:hypothetical protein BKA65DRAFT_467587, partial [Rhexocercosporidium sp. MPI-PUGE-AT-0058]
PQTTLSNLHHHPQKAALAHLGERQTEVHFRSTSQEDIWRHCVRSTEAAYLSANRGTYLDYYEHFFFYLLSFFPLNIPSFLLVLNP